MLTLVWQSVTPSLLLRMVLRTAVPDEGHLPLPMGEVPEAEMAFFTLSVGFAASSPRVGAKGEREERIATPV